MNNRKPFSFILAVLPLALFLLQSCVQENAEEKFANASGEAREYFTAKVLPVLNAKCFSCHTYHNTAASRYDTYSRASAVARKMADRTHSSNPGTLMPPLQATALTEEEKQVFLTFYGKLQGGNIPTGLAAAGDPGKYAVALTWTAYKFPDLPTRAGVSGSFEEVYISYKKKADAASIYEYLHEAQIIINAGSADIGNDAVKNSNVRNHFFAFFTPVIHGRVLEIDEKEKKAVVRFTMNGVARNVSFTIEEKGDDMLFEGRLEDIRAFGAQAALDELNKVCGELHGHKVWPDISLKAEIRNYKNFPR